MATASFVIVSFIIFNGDTSRGMLGVLMWTLCQELHGTIVDLGNLVALFSVGRLLVTTPLGLLCDRYRHKFSLTLASAVLCIGGILWANAYVTRSLRTLYLAQLVLGFGSGTLGVTRSFVVEQTVQAKRTEALSFVTALQYAGFTVSPFLGSILAWVGSLRSGRMAYWTFALPAYFIAIVSLGCVIALQLYFVDIHHADAEEYKVAEVMKQTLPSNTELSSMNSMNNMGGGSHERREIATYSPQKDYQSVMQDTFPTIESADLPRNKSSQPDSSEIRRMCSDDIEAMIKKANFESSDALVTRLLEEPHCNETDSRTEKGSTGNENSNDKQHLPDSAIESEKVTAKQVRLCLFIMIVLNLTTKGTIAVYETLGVHMALEDYEMTVQSIGAIISLSGLIGFVQLLLFKPFWTKFFNDFALMLGGIAVMIIAQLLLLCYTKESHMWRFMVTIVLMYAVGYPIGHTAVLGAFSKIKKSGPQAALLGWFATAGSLARVILPVMSAYLDRLVEYSPFCVVLGLLSLSYLAIILMRPVLGMLIYEDQAQLSIMSVNDAWQALTVPEKLQCVAAIVLFLYSVLTCVRFASQSTPGISMERNVTFSDFADLNIHSSPFDYDYVAIYEYAE